MEVEGEPLPPLFGPVERKEREILSLLLFDHLNRGGKNLPIRPS